MFIDQVEIYVKAGDGGNGIIAWRREKYVPKGGPAGGDGGSGGSVRILVDPNLTGLEKFRYSTRFEAERGGQGGSARQKGRNGQDITLKIPPGTIVVDQESGDLLFDGVTFGDEFLLCQGGRGGLGNPHFRTSTNRAPRKATSGKKGEERRVRLELKMISDIGLIGFPNAGKSTLLNRLTSRDVEVGAYPFTTLRPNIGFLENGISLSDIPGIVHDAHKNRGLGLEFLRHIERTKALVYVLDAAGIDGRDPFSDYHVLQAELHAYDPRLLGRPACVVLNKCDLEVGDGFESEHPVFWVSAETGEGIAPLYAFLEEMVCVGKI